MLKEQTRGFIELPRGGYLVETSEGYFQIGSPPETIKDTMAEKKTPLVFILPNKFFHVEKGISTAELEFPIYFNFFLRQKKTTIICTNEQKDQLITVLKESLMGPEEINLESEYLNGAESFGFPDMKAEMGYFRGYKGLNDVVEFLVFDSENMVNLGKVLVRKLPSGDFRITDGSKETEIPGEVGFNIKYEIGHRLEEPFQAPILGITCLGPSHGFDPEDNTSGFIIWLNHQGIMVDPPVNSTEWLRSSNVNPKLINHVILTHCHADHDAGTFQKIMEENKITIHATATVMESFIRKYSALTKIPRKELLELFHFQPIIIGRPLMINGGEFNFHYALHSIPSVGFEFFFQDQSFVYTSDHLNEPEVHEKMFQKGVLPESRWKFLKEFPWDRRIIYHEAGIPPLHTRVSYLASLPPEIQEKITVYHIARSDMPSDTKLKLARFGIENTVYPEITPPKHIEAYNLLDILSQIDIFSGFPIEKAKEFLLIVREEKYRRGDQIIKKGTPGDKFYIIASGNVKFEGLLAGHSDIGPIKRYGQYEYFGEASLVLDLPRAADVFAETDVVALTIDKNKFLQFIRNTDLRQNLIRLNSIRDSNSWKTLIDSRHFKGLTSHQVTQLEMIMRLSKVNGGSILIEEKAFYHEAYIIRHGKVSVHQGGKKLAELTDGDFVGEIYAISKKLASSYTFKAESETELFSITQNDLIQYIKRNPGVYMRMNTVY
ncbi:cAMP/cGMP-dependent 3',5'-cyclic-AMP/GMP phosphodiesterase [Leptospira wolffii]|uniref:cAMP/cGMP-dependent 3',5'-cyclic-AMP/GMP phosphodiesterase n=1 Tax=Leptospira wolffii TaxID=409998 RepID=UPI000344AE82|nr:cAMP/cGMP-dependent 3',5'-cyclic-AMP/GMP phosphodiesterase [Leptospira wolffii]TGK60072.1 cAMP/cGMP-dependent 3',5'-cyclic-AMP/GMP phosphodiesterase [Leptospira wolffii]TGK72415.1 cAMP/cGMP-dependent 3',5'-cyclic-AMP/GMP phosphodiesterase [Leptospira wolffii]TGK76079.1 cAMP/cGMP-dependent 3',5'-cyclic-AMP/GMP phosphodiesterase [Leptospira wolffii]TGL30331.1 cAMP/cGMP-dependent 3',5'-cyclic-AMP/GMP phosphodiesterase [Leptospira wolffii]